MSNPTALTLAVDAAPAVTAGINLATEGLKLAAADFAANNTDAMVHAEIEKHAQAAIDQMQEAIRTGDVARLQRMGAIL